MFEKLKMAKTIIHFVMLYSNIPFRKICFSSAFFLIVFKKLLCVTFVLSFCVVGILQALIKNVKYPAVCYFKQLYGLKVDL